MADLIHKKLFAVKNVGYSLSADVTLMNRDLIVNLSGGDLPHLGGIVSFDQQTGKIEQVYFASHDGRKHKDILLAKLFVDQIADQVPGNLCVTAGIHIDGITAAQIKASYPMTSELAMEVAEWVKNFELDFIDPRYTTHLKDFKSREVKR
ncbi:hypothetical protein LMC10_03875 [Limosilactobacillus reuteri]|uniref:prenylated flavin chaperone LpdD n=1 Tax=Limosilactobacillus reuteri TaxID=1598 RepID=UPI001E4B2668|nr:hypothetical protein [Limosilactobacillus reuteri]MCC4399231.1 hypothetical protein [Limosilactobacillus reuteri]MCC4404111.1 hypothetical protein [Limosilactobacillus reuteri]